MCMAWLSNNSSNWKTDSMDTQYMHIIRAFNFLVKSHHGKQHSSVLPIPFIYRTTMNVLRFNFK